MLNLINDYIEPKSISEISGIPKNWNKSKYNSKKTAKESMEDLCNKINSRYVLISFNSEGFITKDNMIDILSKLGEIRVFEKKYNTFRASRNLKNRDMHVKEYLFLLKKGVNMSFGDVLRKKNKIINKCINKESWPYCILEILKRIAVEDINKIYPQKVDSDIAIPIYYEILNENEHLLPHIL
jgi:hypothetical protein